MDEQDKISKLASEKKFEAASDDFEVKGKDGGKIGCLKQFELYPNAEFYKLTAEDQIEVARKELDKVLYKHCDSIGWYPDRPPEISKNEKGIFRITAYLKRGTSLRAKLPSELNAAGTVGINDQ